MNHLWRIEMFGGLRAVLNPVCAASTPLCARVVERFRTQKTAALLALLAFEHKPHAREVLIETLWPGDQPKTGSQSLRTALSSLRRQLEPPGVAAGSVLIANHTHIQLHPSGVTTDVAEFENALSVAQNLTERASQIQHFERAAMLYAGVFLPGFYDDWAIKEDERLRDEYFQAIAKLIGHYETSRRHARAFAWAQSGARFDPPEELVRAFKRLARIVDPDLKFKIKRYAPRVVKKRRGRPRKKPRVVIVIENAEIENAQNKNVQAENAGLEKAQTENFEIETVASAVSSTPARETPPDASLPTALELPPQFTRFFGRTEEIARVRAAFEDGSTRLLTLTGMGGEGKTRLAIEAVRALSEIHDADKLWQAAHFVALADVRESHLIATTILESLSLPRAEQALLTGAPAPETFPLERLVAALSSRPTLLVLDNYEHLSHSAALLELLLSRVPHLKILVTSQHRLNVAGEREIAVTALPVPQAEEDFEQIVDSPSAQLFVDRAQLSRPDFQITRANAQDIARLCNALEGSPLALELAAARAGVLSAAQIASQLEAALARGAGQRLDYLHHLTRSATPRHESLRSAIAWSYELLPPDLAKFWSQLAVFRGGFECEAAFALAESAGLARSGVLHWLHQLRACSLLQAREDGGAMRFGWSELLREFAGEQLQKDEDLEARTRRAHAEYFCDLLADGVLRLRTPDEPSALRQAAREAENARGALDWARRGEQFSLAATLALSLGIGLQRSGLHREALERIEAGLLFCEYLGGDYDALKTSLLRECAGLHLDLLHWNEARRAATEMRALCVRQNDEKGLAEAINLLGLSAKGERNFARARRAFEEARARFEILGDTVGLANAHNNLGLIEYLNARGDKTLASTHLSHALRLRRELSDTRGVAEAFINLGALAQQRGDDDEAAGYYSEALEIETQLGHVFGVGRAFCNLGEIAEARGEITRALRFYIAAQSLFETAGVAYQNYCAQRAGHLDGDANDALAQRHQTRRLAHLGALEELVAWANNSD